MRRVITEWGIAISVVFFIAVLLAWADSCLTKCGREPLAVGEGVYMKTIARLFLPIQRAGRRLETRFS